MTTFAVQSLTYQPTLSCPPSSPAMNIRRTFIGAVEDEWKLYSDPSDYKLGSPIGFGASSIVYSAKYKPSTTSIAIPCALKVLDLDSLPGRSLHLLQRKTQLMYLAKHPNVLRVRGTWIDGHKLYIALRLMNAGSAADIRRYGWPGGMQEEVVKCILRQALEGIKFHKPRSFGRCKSFVGTPCWMASEVISGKQYDASADIWSFGITALELSQGCAPRSREKSYSVLLNVVQKDPPTLDRNGGTHNYSPVFEEMVSMCLNKDPSLRPTAAKLLITHFFKSAKKKSYLVGAILSKLPRCDGIMAFIRMQSQG
ncbi:kinase-like domain-containing protein [Abortiporus biennis]|nr:kinase-like domain-containing protein [Abortiporus biennis]